MSTSETQLDDLDEGFDNELDRDDGEDFQLPDPTLYRFVKRQAGHPRTKKNDVYISRRSQLMAQYHRINNLLTTKGVDEVNIHGLGAAMQRAVKLALFLQNRSGGQVEISPSTSSVALYDDYEPLVESLEPITVVRYNSAIHIRVRQKQKYKG